MHPMVHRGCTYHPLKRLAFRGGGVAIPDCDGARQYALDGGASVDPCEGPQGEAEFLHHHEVEESLSCLLQYNVCVVRTFQLL